MRDGSMSRELCLQMTYVNHGHIMKDTYAKGQGRKSFPTQAKHKSCAQALGKFQA